MSTAPVGAVVKAMKQQRVPRDRVDQPIDLTEDLLHSHPDWALANFETVSAAEVNAFNAFYQRDLGAPILIAGDDVVILPQWGLSSEAVEACNHITFTLGSATGAVLLPRALVESWLLRTDPAVVMSKLAPQHAALLLEACIADELQWLEQILGQEIRLQQVNPAPVGDIDRPFTFTLGTAKGRLGGAIGFSEPCDAEQIAMLLSKQRTGKRRLPSQMPLNIRLLIGAVRIGSLQLLSLRPGDVVIIDDFTAEAEKGLLLVGNHLIAPVELSEPHCRLRAPLIPIIGSRWEWIMEGKVSDATDMDLQDDDFEGVPVSVVFELGRATMPLGKLSQLAPGAVVPLLDTSRAIVDVIANGKRVGCGEIVRIGEGLGVRLIRMQDHV